MKMAFDPRKLKKGIPQPKALDIKPKPPFEPHNLDLLGDRVIARRDDNELSEGGLVIPDSARQLGDATVVAVGPGAYQNGVLVPTTLKVGDRVIIAPGTSFFDITSQGKDFVILFEHDIMARVRPDASVLA
jgi:co-chaperonin GroES (HSP10)